MSGSASDVCQACELRVSGQLLPFGLHMCKSRRCQTGRACQVELQLHADAQLPAHVLN